MRAAGGVGAHQGPSSAAVWLRELGQRLRGRGDVVGGGVAARVARPQQARARLVGALRAVVDEREQGVMSEGLLPGCGGVLLLGVGQDQDAVDVHDHLAARVRRRVIGQPPDPLAHVGPSLPHGGQVPGAGRGKRVDQPGDGRIRGHRAEHGGLGPQHTTSDRQSPPSATARARSSRTFPGSCAARDLRHGSRAADSAVSRPIRRTASTSSTPPACETAPAPPPRTRTDG